MSDVMKVPPPPRGGPPDPPTRGGCGGGEDKIIICWEKQERIIRLFQGKCRAEGAGRPSQAIEVLDLNTNQTTTYDYMREAARALNIECSIITNYLKNNQRKPYKKRYIFCLQKKM